MDTSSTYDDEGTHDNNGERTFIQSTELPILDSSAQPVVLIRDVDIERPTPGSRQRKNEFEPYMNGDISNISQYTSQHIQFPNTSATMVPNGKLEKDKEGMTDGDDLYSLCNTQPQCYSNLYTPTWFDMDKVNEMEKLALPEFFDAHEKEYIQYRNYMVEQYRSNPSYFVTISACKKAFPNADTVSLVRLHSFLELYKVINVQNDPRLHLYDPTIDSEPDAYPEFNLHRHLEPVKKVDIHYLRKLIYDSVKSRKTSSTWNVMAEEANNLDGRKIYRCKNCLADCSAIRYQCIKRLDLHLCIDCFVHGRFTAVYASSDFVRMDETNDNEDWTDEEILLLLEGMDQYDDDWLMVSEHVGSRSKEQCITQFLQMPITDDFLTSKLSSKEQDQLPFANTANPVMTMIAYLAAHVNPGVGSAAAKAAMKELLQASATLQEKQQNNTDQQHGDENQTMDVDIDVDEDDDDMDEDSDTTSTPFSKKVLLSATSAALEAAAIQARKLSSYEDQEIQHWTRLAVKTVVDKLALKIQQYEDFDQVLENDLQEMSSQSAVLQTTLENLRKQHYPLPSSDSDPSIPTTTSLDASSSVK
ncbi:SWIRM domain-containing protein [Halteromyces radiatus]|uniref:SWIRM domain-containing protein n=1 Tax=Halteromyces radiatus TaxID=101107 RepID=UPI0022211561|nr:SWIRM domain-containing protein [Halteromyces radiatus]KAI8083041.1 SWIRM domain-containing protein [Halteromyces radiatus]